MNEFAKDFMKTIGKNTVGTRAMYQNLETGEIHITAEYSMPVLKMVMEEISADKKYEFVQLIK